MAFSRNYREHVNPDNAGWQARRKITFALSFGRDCVLPFLPASQADHLHYRNLRSELPLRDLVPLHPGTHQVVTALRKIPYGKYPVNVVLIVAYMLCIAIATPLRALQGAASLTGQRRIAIGIEQSAGLVMTLVIFAAIIVFVSRV